MKSQKAYLVEAFSGEYAEASQRVVAVWADLESAAEHTRLANEWAHEHTHANWNLDYSRSPDEQRDLKNPYDTGWHYNGALVEYRVIGVHSLQVASDRKETNSV